MQHRTLPGYALRQTRSGDCVAELGIVRRLRRAHLKATFVFITLFGVALPLHAGWRISLPERRPDVAHVRYSAHASEGHASFADALKELSDCGRIQHLKGIIAYELLSESSFQQQVFAALQRDALDQFKAALKSAGNMHNPKMQQLRDPFLKAVLATPTVANLNAALSPYGFQVDRVSIEKLELPKTKPEAARRFRGGLWLLLSAVASATEPQPWPKAAGVELRFSVTQPAKLPRGLTFDQITFEDRAPHPISICWLDLNRDGTPELLIDTHEGGTGGTYRPFSLAPRLVFAASLDGRAAWSFFSPRTGITRSRVGHPVAADSSAARSCALNAANIAARV